MAPIMFEAVAEVTKNHILTGLEAATMALGVILIIIGLIQRKKDDGGLSALSGGNQELFAQSKERGMDRIYSWIMMIAGTLLAIFGIIIAILNHVL